MTEIKTETPHPQWWNPMGEWTYKPDSKDPYCLTFTTKSAHLKIRKGQIKDQWSVRWLIFNKRSGEVKGHQIFTTSELVAAFNIKLTFEENDVDYANRHNADCAMQGHFIRSGEYLNIPCPGTGVNGDPNISLRVKEFMGKLVSNFIENRDVVQV